jgi:glycopeptide antibiotics resistance protein
MIDNVIVFIPFGLFLSANFKQVTLWQKLVAIFAFSFVIEIVQYVLAIGAADITDVITNTFGGFIGLVLYKQLNDHIDKEKLDQCVATVILVLLIVLMLLRMLVFRVRY